MSGFVWAWGDGITPAEKAAESEEFVFKNPEFSSLEQTSTMRLETICMMKCLEEVHYDHRKLKTLDFKQVLTEYIERIDGSRMFFLQPEVDEFIKRFASSLDVFLNGGSLTPGFSIFELYRQKLASRIEWIFQKVQANDFELESRRSYIMDRDKEHFVATQSELEQLWKDRLNFEIVNEIILSEAAEAGRLRTAIELSQKPEERTLGRLLKYSFKTAERAKVLSLKTPRARPLQRPVVGTTSLLFKSYRSRIDPCCIKNLICFLHDDGTDVSLPMTLPEKIEAAKKEILRRYKSLLRNIACVEPWMVQERFLNSVAMTYDPHTVFMGRESMEDLRMSLHHSFVGIGAQLGDENGSCVVRELFPGGPAACSGEFQVGDKIVAVAQGDEPAVDVSGMLLTRITKLLRGKKGTTVRVTLQPTGDISARKVVTLVRAEVELDESRASAKFFNTEKGHKVGVIALPAFYGNSSGDDNQQSNSATDLVALINKLKAKEVQGIVLDLRENGGGFLEQSILVGGIFAQGPIVQVRGQYGNIERFSTQKTAGLGWDGPMVVLVSRMSASAAEILAGALKDLNRALIVGDQNTHGKGTVQVLLPMEQLFPKFKYKEDLGASAVTTQKWYLPSGQSTQIKGVASDIVFPSFDALLPIGEGDLPHAIAWDTIDRAEYTPGSQLTETTTAALREKSLHRQEDLSEFQVLKERIAMLQKVVDTKAYPESLTQRRQERKENELAQQVVDARIKELLKSNPSYEKILLDDAAEREKSGKPRVVAKKKSKHKKNDSIDTHLRESLRIMDDFLQLTETATAENI
ncbi:MAG: carboxy terminal-processing peptidase [Verrucomicrobiota bacterium]|nr:MAG: carboxy terminal-processing peptidase [Verrucomicrobiota bacterium]